MTQVVSNRTGRKDIVKAEGENTEIRVITTKLSENTVQADVEIKLNKTHHFDKNFNVILQAYETRGIAKEPRDLGKIKDLGLGEFQITIPDVSIDRLLFRLKVIDNNNIVRGEADEIKPSQRDEYQKIKPSDNSSTILPIREDKRIKLPFSLDIQPETTPILLVKAGYNLKRLFRENLQIKVLIYTSIIRQILTIYLSDDSYRSCPKKEEFLSKVMLNAGYSGEIPSYFKDDGNVNDDAIDWIENLTAECLNTPIIKAGKRIRYLEEFKKYCLSDQDRTEDEN